MLNVRGMPQRMEEQSEVQTCSVSDTRCITAAAAAVGTPATCTSRYVPAGTLCGSPACPAASASALALQRMAYSRCQQHAQSGPSEAATALGLVSDMPCRRMGLSINAADLEDEFLLHHSNH